MKKALILVSLTCSMLGVFACTDDTTGGAAAPATVASADPVDDKKEPPKEGLVTLDPNGSEFNPPVSPDRIPPGAWYCDMGTVHYARPEKGDGKCPLCHMNLKEKK